MNKVLLDTCALVCFLSNGRVQTGDSEKADFAARRRKVDFLREQIARREVTKIVIPAPVLSEVYSASTESILKYMPLLSNRDIYEFVDFGERQAFRLAEINNAIQRVHGDKWGGMKDTKGGWQRLKFDRQIFACAELAGVQSVYTDDAGMIRLCADQGMSALQIQDWPERLGDLFTETPSNAKE